MFETHTQYLHASLLSRTGHGVESLSHGEQQLQPDPGKRSKLLQTIDSQEYLE